MLKAFKIFIHEFNEGQLLIVQYCKVLFHTVNIYYLPIFKYIVVSILTIFPRLKFILTFIFWMIRVFKSLRARIINVFT